MATSCARDAEGKRDREGTWAEENMRCIMHRCPSVESDDGMYRERAHSFSTDRSDRTTVFADGVVGERARAIGSIDEEMEKENFPSARAIASLAGKVASMTDPDGAELHADVALGLLARERETHGTFVFDERRAHHAPYRAQLVEWILDVCAGERYGPTTADVAIAYTDRVLSKTVVPKTSLHLVALCCLQIAVKYEEIEERVPTMSKLRSWTSNMYSPEIIQKMELAVLIELNWNLGVLTPAHFLESFLALTNGGTTEDDEVDEGTWSPEHREELRHSVCQLYSLCAQDMSLLNEPPSRIASAVIATSRVNLGIKPMCSPALRTAADVTPQQIYPLVAHMLKLWDAACGDDEHMYEDEVETSAEFNSLSIEIPKSIAHGEHKMGFEDRVTENASPTCPFDMQWDEE